MKALKVLIGMVMVFSIVAMLALLALGDPVWKWGAAIISICFGIAALGKAFHLRLNTLRGKFHVILGSAALIFSAAMIAGLVSAVPWSVFGLHYLTRFIFLLSVFLMLTGLLKQGYTLSAGDWLQVLGVFAVLAAVALWLYYNLYAGASLLMTVLVYMALLIMLETLAVVRVYLGSDLGWRWTAGGLSVLFITLGDMGMAYSATSGIAGWEIVQYLSWSVMGAIMCVISLMWD